MFILGIKLGVREKGLDEVIYVERLGLRWILKTLVRSGMFEGDFRSYF